MKPEPLKIELTPEAYEDLKRIAKKIKEIDEFKEIDEKIIIRLLAVTFVTFKLREKSAVEWLLKEIEKMKKFYEDKTKEYLNKGDIDSAEIFTAKRDTIFRVINKIKKAFEGVVRK